MITAVIVAAGNSRRMGFDKLAAEIGGQSVLFRSILAFQECEAVDRIVVVTSASRMDWAMSLRDSPYRVSKLYGACSGDAERHLSVYCGLLSVPEETTMVAVHDGARPLVTPAAIARCVEAAKSSGAASLAHRVSDTLKRATQQGQVSESVSRENLWAMETPQVFDFALLRRAYEKVLDAGEIVTDEVSAVQSLGEAVTLVENDSPNPKITVPADIVLAEAILANRL